ncbi:phosphoribosyltransferase family protein [Radiobacillus sp. PE A8.2]|uniref:phosphoribosyltransferase family protein n=1 Tax=Radiobacillus sp. PE A8.2 TaxID=3380349 RepID=UPI00388D620B
MRTAATSTYSQTKTRLIISEQMEVELMFKNNPLKLPIEHLFQMASRVNKKRGFLFVSKVLGKHIPVHPLVPLIISGLLSIMYFEKKTKLTVENKGKIVELLMTNKAQHLKQAYKLLREELLPLDDNPIIIGFAETATALGHGVYECLHNSAYIHTTREVLDGKQTKITFEEEHSHAVDQRCYDDKDLLQSKQPVILVDDEITTGKTALNIIKDIHSKFPREEYVILSILDWRLEEHEEQFRKVEKELNITISTVSILSGNITFTGKTLDESLYDYQTPEYQQTVMVEHIDLSDIFTAIDPDYSFVHETGRFGLTLSDRIPVQEACEIAAKRLTAYKTEEDCLCLGTGEFMFLPMKIASFMGDGILYQSTTRSPIHPMDKDGYAVRNGYRFKNPEDQSVNNYIYNLPKNKYKQLFLFLEQPVPQAYLRPILSICENIGIPEVKVVTISNGVERNE